ncbi:cytochrome P450 2G1-like isoform X2 [Oenanthe melanoleuca]|uniref:cytochrome P450 2G1-like isoform X2 n=1 Tax=Oenanthe melanoleuca TaxID=2939378 RepID=UPI0024C1ABDF|nr:cytochrome P450 2G1-like isoform X2 [Oenanthe melanoleuca]
MAAVLLALLALLALALLSLMSRHRSLASRLPPGPPALPLLGNLLQVSPFRTLQSLLKLSERYGPVFTVWLGPRPVLVLRGSSAVREALVGNPEVFAGRGRMPTVESTFRGYGVVFADGERWRQLRRFSLTVLRDFGMGRRSIESRIQEEAQELLKEFQKTQGKPFDPTFLLSCAVSNIICSIVFGDRFPYEDPEFLELLQMMNDSFREMSTTWSQLYDMAEPLLQWLPGPHRRIPHLLGRMRSFIARRVRDNARSLDPRSPRDFIDAFLIQMDKEKDNPNSEFTMENLELTTLNLFFAGTETVSSTLRFGFLYLMKHPQVEEKVFEEISRVIGFGRAPAVADRALMPFTDATIHEIQRCSDLIPMNVPHRVTQDTKFRGFHIPKGTDVYPLLSSVLHDPESFRNPHEFDPKNFLDEQGRFQRNEAFVPFSAGKRLCLGEGLARMQLFLFLTLKLPDPFGTPDSFGIPDPFGTPAPFGVPDTPSPF